MDRELRARWIATAAAGGDGDDHAAVDHARILARRDRDHDARRAGPAARPPDRGHLGAGRASPTSRSMPTRADTREDVPRGRAGLQGRRTRRARRRGHALPLGPRATVAAGTRSRRSNAADGRTITTSATGCRPDVHDGAATRDRPAGAVRGGAMPQLIRQRRAHRRHLRRSLRHARDRGRSSPPTARAGPRQAAVTMTGFATSVIGCGCEAGIDRELSPQRDAGRPARRPRAAVRGVDQRTAEAAAEPRRPMRAHQPRHRLLRRACRARKRSSSATRCAIFGDGWQISKRFGGKRYWRMPVMDGEFVCEATTGLTKRRSAAATC